MHKKTIPSYMFFPFGMRVSSIFVNKDDTAVVDVAANIDAFSSSSNRGVVLYFCTGDNTPVSVWYYPHPCRVWSSDWSISHRFDVISILIGNKMCCQCNIGIGDHDKEISLLCIRDGGSRTTISTGGTSIFRSSSTNSNTHINQLLEEWQLLYPM